MSTKIMPVTKLRRQISAVLRSIQEEGDVVYITQHGRPRAVMLDYGQYEALLAHIKGWPPSYFVQTYGALADASLNHREQGAFDAREAL